MKVSEARECVAFYFKQKWNCIAGPILANDPKYPLDKMKSYVVFLADKAKHTATQKRIRAEVLACDSFDDLLRVVRRVISNGDKKEFINYTNQRNA